jgi:pantothenate kinase-related protein Tda10
MKKPSTKVVSLKEWVNNYVYKWIQQQEQRIKSETKKL